MSLRQLHRHYAPAAACARKMHYDTWMDAERVARTHAQRDGHMVMAYLCAACGRWANARPASWATSPIDDPIRSEGAQLLTNMEAY